MMEREPHFHYGARFFREGDKDMFEHRIDSRNLIGPRPASKIDKQNHEALWLSYLERQTAELQKGLKKKVK